MELSNKVFELIGKDEIRKAGVRHENGHRDKLK